MTLINWIGSFAFNVYFISLTNRVYNLETKASLRITRISGDNEFPRSGSGFLNKELYSLSRNAGNGFNSITFENDAKNGTPTTSSKTANQHLISF